MRRLFAFFMQSPHVVGTAAGILIAIAIGAYSLSQGLAYKAAADRAAQSRQVSAWVEGLLLRVAAAESGQRGYLLTGNRQYLAPYTAELPGIVAERAKLGSLTPANPDTLRQYSNLIGSKLGEMSETIHVRESAGS